MGVAARCKYCRAEARKPGITKERQAQAALHAAGLKLCGRCGEMKPFSEFSMRRASNDGRGHTCKPCVAMYLSQRKRERPNEFKEWYIRNRERRAEYWRSYYETNKDKRSKDFKAWARANPGKVNALIAKRNAAKRRATVSWADLEAIEAIYIEAAQLTRETGIRHEVDHIYPIQGKSVCGLHVAANLQVLPKMENIRKHNRMPEELRELR